MGMKYFRHDHCTECTDEYDKKEITKDEFNKLILDPKTIGGFGTRQYEAIQISVGICQNCLAEKTTH